MTKDADLIDALIADTPPPGSAAHWPHLKMYETKYIIGPMPPRVLANAPLGTWAIYQVKGDTGAASASLHLASLCAYATNKFATQSIYAKAYRGEPARIFIRATVVERTKEK
jgi:hypothetical protein